MKKWFSSILAVGLAFGLSLPIAAAPEIFVGGGRAYDDMISNTHDNDWQYVRSHATGFYANNFNMSGWGSTNTEVINAVKKAANKFTNKNCFYETDYRNAYATALSDKVNIDRFIAAGLNVKYATINYGFDYERRDALKWRDSARPVLVMGASWNWGGNFKDTSIPANAQMQESIKHCQGGALDTPLTEWSANRNQMRIRDGGLAGGSATFVQWIREINPNFQSMVLIAPNDSTGPEFLNRVKDCIRMHERFSATPTIYAFSFYGPAEFNKCPIMPETDANGQPANTFMGAVYWAMKHFEDPVNWP